MPKNFTARSTPGCSDPTPDKDTEAFLKGHLTRVMMHDTLVKPEAHAAIRARLLARAATQPQLPPLPPARAPLWQRLPHMLTKAVWLFFMDTPPSDTLSVKRLHHLYFHRYYSFKLGGILT